MDWNSWKQTQHSMALEGCEISDDKLMEIAREYEAKGYSSVAKKIVEESNKSGRPIAEVAKEVLSEFRQQNT